jgi:hypothetical protein
MLKRQLRICETWILSPDDVPSHTGQAMSFVFVDDFLGTGTQFSDFLHDTGLDLYVQSNCFIYAPLAGHTDGITYLRSQFPGLYVDAVELLDNTHAFFHEESGNFPDDVNSADAARAFYYDLLDSHQIDIDGSDRRGFGHFELTYAFEHAVPDNSLPILWWHHSDAWSPLFDR